MVEVYTLCLSSGLNYPYEVVHSKRAKYIRIKLSQQGDLSVTVPRLTDINFAHEFIESKAYWIEKNLAKIQEQQPISLPQTLDLKLLDEKWTIIYSETKQVIDQPLKCIQKKNLILELKGSEVQLQDINIISRVLNHWCRKKSKKIFNEMLQNIAEHYGFHYHRLSIRTQKTRWGSCSSQKNINLNSKLLFMPEEVVRYVIIHELCHTIEMNHSSRFWALVEECDFNYRYHKQQLKVLGKEISI